MPQRSEISQELWTVHLRGHLANGDCRSVVINASTGELEGHIIAGSPVSGTALIVPAYQVFQDLRQRFSPQISLSSKYEDCTSGKSKRSLHEFDPKALTEEFRKVLSAKRIAKLNYFNGSGRMISSEGGSSSTLQMPTSRLVHSNLPLMPTLPLGNTSLRFKKYAYILVEHSFEMGKILVC